MRGSIRPVVVALAVIACTPPVSTPSSGAAGAPPSIVATETGVMMRVDPENNTLTFRVDATPEQVWTKLPGIYETLGIPAEVLDSSARVFGTRGFVLGRLDGKRTTEFVRCGNEGTGPSSAGMYRTRLIIVSSLKSAPEGGTLVSTELGGTATSVEGTSSGPVSCSSKGPLEQRIRALLLERLAG